MTRDQHSELYYDLLEAVADVGMKRLAGEFAAVASQDDSDLSGLHEIKDHLISEGWYKRRVITTRSEVNALNNDAVIRDADNSLFIISTSAQYIDGNVMLLEPGNEMGCNAHMVRFPATVLDEGTQP